MGKLKKQDLKKWGILFLILLVPSIILLKCNKGKHNFTTLSIVANPFSSTNMKFLNSDKSVLLDQDSVVFNKKYVSGKINIICFFFSRCPTICPKMITNMNWLKNHFKGFDDVVFISYSIDPEYDSPNILSKYIIDHKIDDNNWYFVTGNKDYIYKLAENYFISVKKDNQAPGGYLHSGSFILLDKEGRMRSGKDKEGNIKAIYDGTNYSDIKNLHKDIQVLKAEYNHEKK